MKTETVAGVDLSGLQRAADEICSTVDKLRKRLAQINTLACYASEENTEAQAEVLIEIGKLARGEETTAWPTL